MRTKPSARFQCEYWVIPPQVNRIYKRIARKAGLDEWVIEGISGHSMRVGAAQDLLNSGASMPIIMQRGRWSKTDTVMRYLEHGNCQV